MTVRVPGTHGPYLVAHGLELHQPPGGVGKALRRGRLLRTRPDGAVRLRGPAPSKESHKGDDVDGEPLSGVWGRPHAGLVGEGEPMTSRYPLALAPIPSPVRIHGDIL